MTKQHQLQKGVIKMIWKKTKRTKATKTWMENTDPIRLTTYYILLHVKFLVMALVVYIFILTVTEGVFILQNVEDNAVGTIERRNVWDSQKKRIKFVGVDLKNSGFKKQTNITKLFVLDANVTGELLPLEYR